MARRLAAADCRTRGGNDGETTWFEGVLLLAIYLLFALAFYFV